MQALGKEEGTGLGDPVLKSSPPEAGPEGESRRVRVAGGGETSPEQVEHLERVRGILPPQVAEDSVLSEGGVTEQDSLWSSPLLAAAPDTFITLHITIALTYVFCTRL